MLIGRQDLSYAVRSARRTPLLTVVVILALSVGIGLNAGVFTILNALILQPPVIKDRASFVQLYPRYDGWISGAAHFSTFTAEDYDAIRTQSHTLAQVAAWQSIGTTLDDVHQSGSSMLVTCNYFAVYGIDRPLFGRFLLPEECKAGTAAHVAVLSERYWRHFYNADPKLVGKVIHISHQSLTVVGIAPESAAPILSGATWMPYTLQPVFNHGQSFFQTADWPWLSVAARLRQGYSSADARAELETILHQRDRLYLERKISTLDRRTAVVLTNGSFIQTPAVRPIIAGMMALIMGPLFLVLLLACTNVTMLFLSRSVVRRGEMAIRMALGAGRARLVRMLVVESLLTAAAAGAISVYLAWRVPGAILSFLDPLGFAPSTPLDGTVFAYLAALVLLATVISALAPARESFRLDIVTALKGREGAATMRSRTTGALIVVQLAMSFVLISAAVLFGRLPARIANIDPGFETRRLLAVPLEVTLPPYDKNSALTFFHTLTTRVQALPGVQSVAFAGIAPFNQPPPTEIRLSGQTKGQGRPAALDEVSPDFFRTFGIGLTHGRGFLNADVSAAGSAQAAVVSEAFAKAFWGGEDPTGKVLVLPDDKRLLVVGVAKDTRSEHYGELDGPRLYTLRDPQSLTGQFYVRFTGDTAPVAQPITEIIKGLDPSQLTTPETLRARMDMEAGQMRSLAEIVLFMAVVAVVLAISGVYAVLTFVISQRTREFGIQMVLGASRRTIFGSVFTRGLRQIGSGLVFGVVLATPAAWFFTRLARGSTLQVQAFDPGVYAIAAVILLVVSLFAMYLPAMRATRVDPIEALRND